MKWVAKHKSVLSVLFLIYILAVGLRLYVVRNYNFPFWFDPGRDAIVSREILEKRDLKIQGPNASGTGDTVFHGVLYYYLIGPLYTLFAGDPQLVLNSLIFLTALAIIPVYLLAFEISENKSVGFLAAFLYAFSYDAIRGNTWLSNPIIASVTIPTFFYLLFKIFYSSSPAKLKQQLLPYLAFVLALTHQSVILFVTLWGLVVVGFIRIYDKKTFAKRFPVKILLISLGVYLLGISTMILAQTKAWLTGVFNPFDLKTYAGMSAVDVNAIFGTIRLYLLKISQDLFPSFPVLSVISLLFILGFINKQKRDLKHFWFLVFSYPLFLLSWHYRNMYHSFLGMEDLLVVALAAFIVNLPKTFYRRILQILIVLIFVISNINMYKLETHNRLTPYYLPQGAYLKDQLELIDYTYAQANGADFSISTLTYPYAYNTLWSYLYSWYGMEKYGYVPKLFANDQVGMFGADLLEHTDNPQAIHFSIYEPKEGIDDWMFKDFANNQTSRTSMVQQFQQFGSMKVELRTYEKSSEN